MLLATLAHLRFAASVAFGTQFARWSLDGLVESMLRSEREFGPPAVNETKTLAFQVPDEAGLPEMQLRRVRQQALRAATETLYFDAQYAGSDVDLRRMSFSDIQRLPLTRRAALSANPNRFVCSRSAPSVRLTTTGATGAPVVVCFSSGELAAYIALGAIDLLRRHTVASDDVVALATSSRAYLGNLCFAGACTRIGALVDWAGLDEPATLLRRLAERRRIAGKKERVSVLQVYPSYLGELIETGRTLGYGPADFGIQRLLVGGEVTSAGLLERSRALFGDVTIEQGYGMTEIWPVGGTLCEQGHLHFEPALGLVETVDPETGRTSAPNAVASLVVTPFAPFRETTLVIRYDTEDLVAPLAPGARTCSMKALPATGGLLGKKRLSVRHPSGWTCPRHVLDALEALDEVPLPARCGFWRAGDGVGIEVVARSDTAQVRGRVADALETQGVPLRSLQLHTDPAALRQPLPLRADLREVTFQTRCASNLRTWSTNPCALLVDAMEG